MATPAQQDDSQGLREKSEGARDVLRTLVDEMRLQMRLGSMEAKGAWEDLEPQLRRMESRLEEVSYRLKQATEESEVQAHLAALDAKDRWAALQESMSDVVESVLESVVDKTRAPKRAVDRSKVQAHLARLEVESKLEQAADELKTRMRDSRADVLQEGVRFIDGLTEALSALKERLERRKG